LNLKVWVGIAISAGLLWLSARDVDFGRAWYHIQTINGIYLIPFLALIAAEVLIRSLKWQVLLQPVKRCSFWRLNAATLIGLMANNLLPARAGEFVRAYAGARIEAIPFSMAFATVVIDRVLDGLTVSAIFLVVLLLQPLPDEIRGAGALAALLYAGALIVLVGLIVRHAATRRLLTVILRPFPTRLSDFVLRALEGFVQGLAAFRRAELLVLATLISVVIWLGYALTLYVMFLAFAPLHGKSAEIVSLSPFHALVVLLILTIVLTLPSSPGFVGTMHWAIRSGLVFFGVDESQAFALALVYHITQYVPITVGGIVVLWLERMTVAEIAHATGTD
jgi:uncharacterized protein (TIRG00374 family)